MKQSAVGVCSFGQFAFLSTKDSWSKEGVTHNGLRLSTSIINQEKVQKTCPHASLRDTIPQIRLLLSLRLQVYQVGKNKTKHKQHKHSETCLYSQIGRSGVQLQTQLHTKFWSSLGYAELSLRRTENNWKKTNKKMILPDI